MARRRVVVIVAVIGVALAALALRKGEPPAEWYERVAVRRGDLVEVVNQLGELAPRDPVLIKAPFDGRLQFVIADGSWVDVGDALLSISEDDQLKEAADVRSQMLSARQELRLARIKRRHAQESEDLKLAQAQRGVTLERLRHRILSSSPVGGDELIELDGALRPLEAETAGVRTAYDQAQRDFQARQDAYLEALDARTIHRDRLLRLAAQLDALRATAAKSVEGLTEPQLAERAKAVADLPGVQAERAELESRSDALAERLRDARRARDAAAPARDAAAKALAEREAAEEDLRVRLEIEKRGLTLTTLRLDEESARLAAEESARKRDQGRLAFAASALSRVELDALEDEAQRSANQLDILRARVAINARPLTDEQRADADAKLARAESTAASAGQNRERALAQSDLDIAVLEARVRRIAFTISSKSRNFPAILEANIDFIERELAGLDVEDPDDAARRGEAEADLVALRAQLQAAKADPPNLVKASVAGVVRVRRDNDRLRQAGDQVYEEDVICELYPPTTMAVLARVNEVEVRRIAIGMTATVTVPALPDFASQATVIEVAGMGRDKFAADGQTAGVVQFAIRLRLAQPAPELRQGMTALVAIAAGAREGALWLPMAAVRRDGERWLVLAGDADAPVDRAIAGEPYGDDAFAVSAGAAEGETVFIKRTANK